MAYSPLGRGLLGGTITRASDLSPDDWRLQTSRYQGDDLERNVALVDRVRALAASRGCTPAQLALAWVLAQGEDIVPIPGTKRRTYLEQNVAAASLELSTDDLAALDAVTPPGGTAAGDRYHPSMLKFLNG